MEYAVGIALNAAAGCLIKYRLLVFFAASIAYMELVYRLWSFKSLNADFLFPLLFSIPAGTALFLAASLFTSGVNRILAVLIASLLFLVYAVQLVYYGIFRTPLSIFSFTGAGEAMRFWDIIGAAILKNFPAVVLLAVPAVLLIKFIGKIPFAPVRPLAWAAAAVFYIAAHALALLCVHLTGESATSQRSLYYKASSLTLSVGRLGLLTTVRLDLVRLVSGAGDGRGNIAEAAGENTGVDDGGRVKALAERPAVSPPAGAAVAVAGGAAGEKPDKAEGPCARKYNVLDIDFAALAAAEKDPAVRDMHRYFFSVSPTAANEYTGLFKGCNLILITAESFSPYAISPELTPTLYGMSKEGFVFTNFYNPIWGVSTSDGEYAACTGLIPKSGVWSFARSGSNYLPFVMGNQFKKLGYAVKACHDHNYTYYKRNVSHPNMGYEYMAVGNGLDIKKTWPESDLEMIEATAGDFTAERPFHSYYMTVSGHMNYSFGSNYIARKNRSRVEELPFSNASKAYIACNLELEAAMRALLDRLEAAGVLKETVIALSPDHYPYGLSKGCIDELAGHRVESNFELYKSTFILWKKGMEPVVVDRPCSSLDINPTLSNLFGLEYDSRLLMGRDILSDSPPLVIFSNYSWITDRARFDASANRTVFTDGSQKDGEYIKGINKTVADRFKYSEKILDYNYYGRVSGIMEKYPGNKTEPGQRL